MSTVFSLGLVILKMCIMENINIIYDFLNYSIKDSTLIILIEKAKRLYGPEIHFLLGCMLNKVDKRINLE